MKHLCLLVLVLVLLPGLMACSVPGTPADDTEPEITPKSQKLCGDDICDGPENAENCPEDCAISGIRPDDDNEEENDTTGKPTPKPTQTGVDEMESGYRYVSFGGTIHTEPNTASMGDFTGIAFGYAGEYQIELWFPMAGGDAVQQRNTIALTQFNDLYFDAEPCEWDLNEDAFTPASFELQASLTLNTYQQDGEPADDLSYQLISLPQKTVTGIVTCQGSPDAFSDPAAYAVLTSWFTVGRSNPVQLKVIETNSYEREAITPLAWFEVPEETLSYITVPDLDTP